MGSVRALACFLILASAAGAAPVPAAPKVADDEATPAAAKLLKHRKVQKELKLSAEQRIAILDGLADIEEAVDKKRLTLAKLPNPTPDVFDKLEKEHQASNEKLFKTAAAKTLNPPQRARLKQIHRQIHGPNAFIEAAVEKLLAPTDAQKKAVADFAKTHEEKIDAYLINLGSDESDNKKEDLLKFRTESLKSLVAGLTEDQRAIWKSLLGEPVKGFDPIDLWFAILEEDDDKPIP